VLTQILRRKVNRFCSRLPRKTGTGGQTYRAAKSGTKRFTKSRVVTAGMIGRAANCGPHANPNSKPNEGVKPF
jgi:hypothetical protein